MGVSYDKQVTLTNQYRQYRRIEKPPILLFLSLGKQWAVWAQQKRVERDNKMKLHEKLGIGDKLAERLVEYLAAREEAQERRQAFIAAFAAIDLDLRIPQLMNFYWQAPKEFGDKVLSSQEMKALGNPLIRTDAEFRQFAKAFQPHDIINCPGCNQPFVVAVFRNGRKTRDKCKACGSADYAIECAERRKFEAEMEQDRREHEQRFNAITGKVIRERLALGPMTKTKVQKRMWWAKHAFAEIGIDIEYHRVPDNFDEVFDGLVEMGILVPCDRTKNGRIIYELEAKFFRESAVA
jgi:hypothetical protein